MQAAFAKTPKIIVGMKGDLRYHKALMHGEASTEDRLKQDQSMYTSDVDVFVLFPELYPARRPPSVVHSRARNSVHFLRLIAACSSEPNCSVICSGYAWWWQGRPGRRLSGIRGVFSQDTGGRCGGDEGSAHAGGCDWLLDSCIVTCAPARSSLFLILDPVWVSCTGASLPVNLQRGREEAHSISGPLSHRGGCRHRDVRKLARVAVSTSWPTDPTAVRVINIIISEYSR